ncbi:conserved hypothetical protein [Frankia sp. AiPs1]|uniref:glycosyltransferase n=1 Tax=Frankia sp. AiPa1 TaxID=573492 RepID=UPI00202B0EF3|nr:glycosyltransferase [Frankia sp. AiPa1]MCL9761545.1 glycosyltransferase [Frankia sp. AiPa1]
MKIFGWAADEQGCGYYRISQPMAALRALGHETHTSTVLTAEWADADVIVGQRVCNPGPSTTWQRLAADGRRLVFEVDDDLTRIEPGYNPAGHRTFGQPEARRRIRANMAAAAMATVTTEPLARAIREHAADVRVIPNMIPAALLDHARPRRERLTVGWAGGGVGVHELGIREIAAPLRQFLARTPEADVHLMGSDYRPELRVPTARLRYTPWIESVPGYHRSVDFDVGLAPLRPHLFNQSKSDIRILELAALGIPVIASGYGPYAEAVQHGVTGYLCRQPHEWVRALTTLAHDQDLRAEMGAAARTWAASRTIEDNIHIWEEVLHATQQPGG